ncbi:RNase H domain-containing protein [Aspergillus minisclerotigenes]|uniref:RNase H domain-containing protein n=1 Tax=Aspergillus minisclerotigenes TaxID=656917 RepID=A0A5N6JLZ4_9EURO|nr:RNase H domain-containing protein [Aspergillus minisclerotigenes]
MRSNRRHDIFTYAEFDIQGLCRLASSLRQGSTCQCDVNQVPKSGSFNWAIYITFDDGIEWVLRSPHTGYGSISKEISSKLLESEAATLNYVRRNSDIPVPHVYSYSSTKTNDVGIPYILMSKATGFPLQRVWKSTKSGQTEISAEIKSKVLFQLGSITFKLSQLRFDCIGSLFEHDGIVQVGECLSRGHILHERYSLEDIPRGPFTSETQFYDSLIEALIQHAETLPLSHHCFVAPVPRRELYDSSELYNEACDLWNDFVTVGCKIDSSDNRLDYIIAGEALRDIVPKWQQYLPKLDSNSFPLCHSDLSVNNIYVDKDYNITCIIDWAFSSSVPEAMALIPPGLPQSRDELHDDLAISFKDGFQTAILKQAKGIGYLRSTTSKLFQQSKCAWSLNRLLNFDSIDDHGLLSVAWEWIHGSGKDFESYFADRRSLSCNINRYKEIQMEDQPPEKIDKAERDYFRDDVLKRSIARSLTVTSQWQLQYDPSHEPRLGRGDLFIADSKLWKWVSKVIQEREDAL